MLQIDHQKDKRYGDVLILRGALTQGVSKQLEQATKSVGMRVTYDLAGIEQINSNGIAEWIRFHQNNSDGKVVSFIRVSVPVINMVNMMPYFLVGCKLLSFNLPYVCSQCRHEFELTGIVEGPDADYRKHKQATCPKCEGKAELDDIPDDYFAFLGVDEDFSNIVL